MRFWYDLKHCILRRPIRIMAILYITPILVFAYMLRLFENPYYREIGSTANYNFLTSIRDSTLSMVFAEQGWPVT